MAESDFRSPVSELDLASAREQLKNLDLAEREIQKAKRAGIDVAAQEQQARELRVKLMQILQTYFPGQL